MSRALSSKTISSAGAATAAVAAAFFLNDRYGLSHDIGELAQTRKYKQRIDAKIKELGDDVTIYRMLELARPDASALWFEGRTWTYAELKAGSYLCQHRLIARVY